MLRINAKSPKSRFIRKNTYEIFDLKNFLYIQNFIQYVHSSTSTAQIQNQQIQV